MQAHDEPTVTNAEKAPVMDIDKAAAILTGIQAVGQGNRKPCRLRGDMVMVSALAGNAFQIMSIPVDEPRRLPSYTFLEDLGSELHVERDSGSLWFYVCVVTWDTALHYLVRNGALKPTK